MHCKNIKIVDEPQAGRKRRINVKRKRKPKIIYKIIDIAPFRTVLRKINGKEIENIGFHRAFHICRGHLRTYSDEKPLFGKHTGTYFVPAHTRGKQEKGIIIKDYQIKKVNGQH